MRRPYSDYSVSSADNRASPDSYQIFKSQPSAFTREYLYTVDEKEEKKPSKPSGFTYATLREARDGKESPALSDGGYSSNLNGQRKATALAFTYKPDVTSRTPSQQSETTSQPASQAPQPAIRTSTAKSREAFFAEVQPQTYTLPQQERATEVKKSYHSEKLTSKNESLYQQKTISPIEPKSSIYTSYVPTSRAGSYTPTSQARARTTSSPSAVTPPADTTGRVSQQSGLDSSTSSSSSSLSELDEYAHEENPLAESPIKEPINAKQFQPEPSRPAYRPGSLSGEVSNRRSENSTLTTSSYAALNKQIKSYKDVSPTIMHASRRKVVTKSDGTVEEIEEVVEPGSHYPPISAPKPVVVGVVPTLTKISPSSEPVHY